MHVCLRHLLPSRGRSLWSNPQWHHRVGCPGRPCKVGCGAVGTGQCWVHELSAALWAGWSGQWVGPGTYPPPCATKLRLDGWREGTCQTNAKRKPPFSYWTAIIFSLILGPSIPGVPLFWHIHKSKWQHRLYNKVNLHWPHHSPVNDSMHLNVSHPQFSILLHMAIFFIKTSSQINLNSHFI